MCREGTGWARQQPGAGHSVPGFWAGLPRPHGRVVEFGGIIGQMKNKSIYIPAALLFAPSLGVFYNYFIL